MTIEKHSYLLAKLRGSYGSDKSWWHFFHIVQWPGDREYLDFTLCEQKTSLHGGRCVESLHLYGFPLALSRNQWSTSVFLLQWNNVKRSIFCRSPIKEPCSVIWLHVEYICVISLSLDGFLQCGNVRGTLHRCSIWFEYLGLKEGN